MGLSQSGHRRRNQRARQIADRLGKKGAVMALAANRAAANVDEAARQLTRVEATVLAHYANGEGVNNVPNNSGVVRHEVIRIIDQIAYTDRTRARNLVRAYQRLQNAAPTGVELRPEPVRAPLVRFAAGAAPSPAAVAARAAVSPARVAERIRAHPPKLDARNALVGADALPAASPPVEARPVEARNVPTPPGPAPTAGEEPVTTPDTDNNTAPDLDPAAGSIEDILKRAADAKDPGLAGMAEAALDLVKQIRDRLTEYDRKIVLYEEMEQLQHRMAQLTEILGPQPFQPAAPKTPTPSGRRSPVRAETPVPQKRAKPGDVRTWANRHGFEISAYGKFPAGVVAAYNRANPDLPYTTL